MKKKWLFPIAFLMLAVLVVPFLSGCSLPASAQEPPQVPQVQINQQPQGIWVSGSGSVKVTPDIATLMLGIVSQESSVAESQAKASDAMNKLISALKDAGIAQKDIRTGYFNINQSTRWDDQTRTEIVTGYQVSNMVNITVRDTDKVGSIIDSVVEAGGDLVRINNINFSIEDPTLYYQQAREKAVADAKTKAEQLAKNAGITLGEPVYINENVQSPVYYDGYRSAMAIPAPVVMAASMPPISPGETQVTLNVQMAFSIAP